MVSAPPLIAWKYRVEPQPGSEEARVLEVLRGEPREWAPPYAQPQVLNYNPPPPPLPRVDGLLLLRLDYWHGMLTCCWRADVI